MPVSPFFKTPLTDLTGCIINHQQYDKCGKFEMNMMECMEAYGFDKGKLKCKALIEDFQECTGEHKQRLRIEVSEWNNEYNDLWTDKVETHFSFCRQWKENVNDNTMLVCSRNDTSRHHTWTPINHSGANANKLNKNIHGVPINSEIYFIDKNL